MRLGSLLADFRDRDHQLTIYRSGDPSEIELWLTDRGVSIDARSLPPGGPKPFIEIETGGKFVGIIGEEQLVGLLDPPIDRPGERDGIDEGYRVLFEVLDDTVFRGLNRRELLAVSREIEERAFRIGNGTLRVSFQTVSKFRSQAAVYDALATRTSLDIHIYGAEDWEPPAINGITFHGQAAERFEAYWSLAFDGGTDVTQACGLVAEEKSAGYNGFWTNDPGIVEEISSALTEV